jgi:hypothetical protein
VLTGSLESRAKYRRIVQASIAKWVKDFQDGRIKIDSVEDLKKLISMEKELQEYDLINIRRLERLRKQSKDAKGDTNCRND